MLVFSALLNLRHCKTRTQKSHGHQKCKSTQPYFCYILKADKLKKFVLPVYKLPRM
nr:MAG TPA: hypothetical protein [Caudoviricetes sp.]